MCFVELIYHHFQGFAIRTGFYCAFIRKNSSMELFMGVNQVLQVKMGCCQKVCSRHFRSMPMLGDKVQVRAPW